LALAASNKRVQLNVQWYFRKVQGREAGKQRRVRRGVLSKVGGGHHSAGVLHDTIEMWRVALTIGTMSPSNSSEAASSEFSQASHPSLTSPYGRTLKGGCPTGAPRSKELTLFGSCQQFHDRRLAFRKVCWVKLYVGKVRYVKSL
jgi:hypothetical protein